VDDAEAVAGVQLLAKTEGIFAEAAGGVVVGALRKLAASGIIKRDELAVALITGAGPRTQEIMTDVVRPIAVRATIESVEESLGAPV
jgi:threonine synthase